MLTGLHQIIAADLSAEHSCCEFLVLPHPRDAILNSDLLTGEATDENLLSC